MVKKKNGAGNFVQPNLNDGYDIYVEWEIKDNRPSHVEAVQRLYEFLPERKTVPIG